MARYRKVSVQIWNDALFRTFTDDGKLAFLFVLTHPQMTSLGAMRATVAGLAAEIGWKPQRLREAFAKAFERHRLVLDEESNCLWMPRFMRHNLPESPNVVRSWASSFEAIPECAMKADILEAAADAAKDMPEGFRKAFESLRKGLPQVSPNPEPEPEPEPEQEKNTQGAGEDLAVFEAWRGTLPEASRKLAKFTDPRRAAIKARRNDGHSQETLLAAAVGWVNDPWDGRAQQNDLVILFRPANFEKFAALAKTGPPPRRSGAFATVHSTPENDAAYEAAWSREPDA